MWWEGERREERKREDAEEMEKNRVELLKRVAGNCQKDPNKREMTGR